MDRAPGGTAGQVFLDLYNEKGHMMRNVTGCSDTQIGVPLPSPAPKRQDATEPKVQNAEELLSLDFCDISDEAGGLPHYLGSSRGIVLPSGV